ncbi:2-phosphosulfolactate phosphatase [Rathayibacter sp. YIM 133350]|uniref:2-phosphosulfolactate phosphatase n=1 Tax=Rathayibacter sp. YIM 133350 TaxID=3131992 RepID=UPI00307DE08C
MSQTVTVHPHAQSKYQVRFDWGAEGAARVAADADVVVWVDVLGEPDAVDTAFAGAADFAGSADRVVLAGGLVDAALVARRVLELQEQEGRRTFVAVIAAGAGRPGTTNGIRFCVEDLLGAGAVIDALAGVGIDYSSPEAAAACAAFTGLRGAVSHLATASASGQELLAQGATPAQIRAAATLDSASAVRELSSSQL